LFSEHLSIINYENLFMRKHLLILLLVLVITTSGTMLMARMFRENQIPHGNVKACLTCHVTPGGARNAFGREIENNFLSVAGAGGNVVWGPELAALDSDGDGFTNGEELQDPLGLWRPGQPLPGDRSLVTNPGDPADFPNVTSITRLGAVTAGYELSRNYPNPFNPSTTIEFSVPNSGKVRLDVYSITGDLVRTLWNEEVMPGQYATRWNGRDDAGRLASSAMYLYRLTAGDVVITRRMVMLK
jgi:hypothetical protein